MPGLYAGLATVYTLLASYTWNSTLPIFRSVCLQLFFVVVVVVYNCFFRTFSNFSKKMCACLGWKINAEKQAIKQQVRKE